MPMNFTITFQNLPFTPERNQVIYIENRYNETWNTLIQDNYERLRLGFRMKGKDFVYLPKLLLEPDVEKKVRYYAPYLTSQILEKNLVHSTLLLKYLKYPECQDSLSPSFIYHPHTESESIVTFSGIALDGLSEHWIDEAIEEICPSSRISFSLRDSLKDECHFRSIDPVDKDENLIDVRNCKAEIRFPETTKESATNKYCEEIDFDAATCAEPEIKEQSSAVSRILGKFLGKSSVDKVTKKAGKKQAVSVVDEEEEIEITQLIENLQYTAERLKLKGVALAAVHELIDVNNPLSRLVISDDLRIQLPDYHVEIKMAPICKAVFFLFLNHPEGIRLKELHDYYNELYNYYRQCQTRYTEPKMRVSITELCNPTKNNFNEAISRINSAFKGEFDEHLAKNYYISGNAGELYRIGLDRELVVWED